MYMYWSSLCLAVGQFVQLHNMMDWLASCMTCKLAYSRFVSCCFVDWLGGEVVGWGGWRFLHLILLLSMKADFTYFNFFVPNGVFACMVSGWYFEWQARWLVSVVAALHSCLQYDLQLICLLVVYYLRLADIERPRFTTFCPYNIDVFAKENKDTAQVVIPSINATDNSGELPTITVEGKKTNYTAGRHLITITASDASGNKAACRFYIEVKSKLSDQYCIA